MFLVDKYNDEINENTYEQEGIDILLDKNELENNINKYMDKILELPNEEFMKVIEELEYGTKIYSNFQHLIIYGPDGSGKEFTINKLLEKIFGKPGILLKEIEYTVSGYSNTKTKIMIKQSKNHIIIEPNSNGFDKYLIQEIIQDYAKSELLNIVKNRKQFKVVVINKIDNLSYYAQASLRRTMEKYSNTCKFILVSNQLSKIIEPLRSRCLLLRVPLPSNEKILETILHITEKEQIQISWNEIKNIINESENNINYTIWLLNMYKYNTSYEKNWELLIDDIINMITNSKIINNKALYRVMKKVREIFYTLFITNISTSNIIKKILIKLLNRTDNLETKQNMISITSIFEKRINQGTRHIIHLEAYIIRLIELLNNKSNKNENNFKIMDVLEI
jgi:replication factor C subunit 3/5